MRGPELKETDMEIEIESGVWVRRYHGGSLEVALTARGVGCWDSPKWNKDGVCCSKRCDYVRDGVPCTRYRGRLILEEEG